MALIHDSSSDTLVYTVDDIVLLTGNASTLSFDGGGMGDSTIVVGTNDFVGAGTGFKDSAIYDLGQGTGFAFYDLGSQAMTFADLKIYNIQSDPTAKVWIETQFGQTSTMTPDGDGGTLLKIGGSTGGTVDFVRESMANLATHLSPTNL